MMKFRWLGMALVAATALTPLAASAQDEVRGGGFGARVVNEAIAREAPAPERVQVQRPQRQAEQPRPQRAERGNGGGWEGRRERRGGDEGAQGRRGGGEGWQGRRGGGEIVQDGGQPQGRWEGRRGGWRAQPGQDVQGSADGATVERDGRRWEGRRGGGFGSEVVREAERRRVPVQPGSTFDRDNDGRVDPQWDRNRNGRVDEVWDDNRNGRLDRRWDRNRDGRLDGRWDRNDDERVDRRWDRNGNGRVDNRYRRYGGWDRSWRYDRRYDWYGHRARYGDIFRLGRYYSPYRDWRYRRLDIGFSLWPLFYTERYWINDPWQYRLPEVWGPYRWVRYYDDALLVDLRSGQVVDVIHGVFW